MLTVVDYIKCKRFGKYYSKFSAKVQDFKKFLTFENQKTISIFSDLKIWKNKGQIAYILDSCLFLCALPYKNRLKGGIRELGN